MIEAIGFGSSLRERCRGRWRWGAHFGMGEFGAEHYCEISVEAKRNKNGQ
jgi:hypothetical protein